VDVEALRELEPDFWRAPSAHNTQPWVLRYGPAGYQGAVEVGWDPACALPDSDPTGRDLRLSLGAFVECCLVVCAGAGLAVDFVPDYSEPDRRAGRLVAGAGHATPFGVEDVRRRACNRAAYEPGRLPDEIFAELDGLAAEAGGRLVHVPCRELIGLLWAADRHQFGTPSVVRELRAWLRLTPRHPDYHRDGLTDRALALRRFEAAGLRAALASYPVLRRLGLPRLLAGASRGLLDYDGSVLVLVGPAGCDAEGQLELGRALMRQWLTLSGHGYATHPLSQIIDSAAGRADLARLLAVDDPSRLLNVVRVGRPAAPGVRSARRVSLVFRS
jgi:hypothetical protein